MKKYKVMTIKSGIVSSPAKFQNFEYGTLKDVIGMKCVCKDFDQSGSECSRGYYATDIEGIMYTNLGHKNAVVFEVDVSGMQKIFNEYKQRFEVLKFIRVVPTQTVKSLVKKQSDKMDWDLYQALFPHNPFLKTRKRVSKKDIKKLKVWASVGASVWASVGDSVWASVGVSVGDSVGVSVGDSVWDSVWDSVKNNAGGSVRDSVKNNAGGSVRDSVWAYVSSLFPNIEQWRYVKHKKGTNPFLSCIDLWNKNLVPSFDGKTWRLHTGPKAATIYEWRKR